ncbi:MAG: FAD-dependent oxidoreductase [Pseudomonadota bacterium]
MTENTQVLIVGGGAMGVSCLYHLTKLGRSDVTLLEKNELTAGSTWHAAGLCTHFAHNLTIQAMRAHSVKLYSGILEEETGQPVSFHRSGAIRVTRSAERLDEFRHVQGIGKFSGFNFNILTPNQLKEIYPLVETDGLLGAIHEPDDGHVDPSQATQAMAAGARAGGAKIHRHTKVTAIDRKNDGWHVTTDKATFIAEHLVMAAGTWAYEIGGMAGLDLPVVPVLHQYLVTARIDAVAAQAKELPIIRDPEESWYVRQERHGMIIGPYERTATPWSIDHVPPEFGMDLLPPDLDAVQHIVEAAMARIPCLAEGGLKTVVNGPITFTPDAGPLIGPAFDLPRCWLLTGSSMGVMEGGGAGKFLAEWIVEGAPPMDALAVDPRRFGGWADRDYRLDKAIESFGNQFAIHYPYEEREAGRPRLMSSLHDRMKAAGARFGQAYGWERPNWFGAPAELTFRRPDWLPNVAEECRAVAERVAVADLSVFSKFLASGPGAAGFMETLGANRPPRPGRIGLSHALTPAGGIASEFTVTHLRSGDYYLTSAAAARRHDHDLLRTRASGEMTITDITETRGVLGVMGPQAPEVLQELTKSDLSSAAFPWLSAQEITMAGVQVLALRLSYVGEAGWELHADMADLPRLYDAVLAAGQARDIGHYGAYAMNALRLERGYPAWGLDLTTERTPMESGLSRFVKSEDRTFIGKDALLARETEMSLHLLDLDPPDHHPFGLHPVMAHGESVGLVTSAAFGHRMGKFLAFAYLRAGAPTIDLTVEICGEVSAARLHPPVYDPKNLQMRYLSSGQA